MLSSAIMKRLQGDSEGQDENNGVSSARQSIHAPRFPGSSLLDPAVSHAESAMRHSFQSQGFPSPLPKLSLPSELNMLDHLFQNPMGPNSKASDLTAYRHEGTPRSPAYYANGNGDGQHDFEANQGQDGDAAPGGNAAASTPNRAPVAATTPQDPATTMYYANGGSGPAGPMPYGEGELATNGFDFLSFLAADDGGQGANAVWEQTEPYRQDMPMLG